MTKTNFCSLVRGLQHLTRLSRSCCERRPFSRVVLTLSGPVSTGLSASPWIRLAAGRRRHRDGARTARSLLGVTVTSLPGVAREAEDGRRTRLRVVPAAVIGPGTRPRAGGSPPVAHAGGRRAAAAVRRPGRRDLHLVAVTAVGSPWTEGSHLHRRMSSRGGDVSLGVTPAEALGI